MRDKGKSFLNVAGAGALALVVATSAFAAPQPQRGYDRRTDDRGPSESRDSRGSYRDNERVNASGRITSFSKERGGYRVQLDRGRESYWIPASRIRNRGNDLRVGVSIVLGGIYRGGRIDVDAVSWPGNAGYRDDSLRGVVERVDLRDGLLRLRADGRTIDVDMRDTARSSRIDLNDLRRGDYVTLSGQWLRGGNFAAYQIESVDTGRW